MEIIFANFKNPIQRTQHVMEKTAHIFDYNKTFWGLFLECGRIFPDFTNLVCSNSVYNIIIFISAPFRLGEYI